MRLPTPLAAVALLATALLLSPTLSPAQPARPGAYDLLLHTGRVQPPANLPEFCASPTPTDLIGGYYYRIVQFAALPPRATRQALQQQGLHLLEYLPHNAYLVAFPQRYQRTRLQGFAVRSVIPLSPQARLTPALRRGEFPDHARRAPDQFALVVKYAANLPIALVTQAVEATGASIEELHPQDATLIVRIQPGAALSQLAATPGITFIEPVAPPPTPDDTPSRSNHRSNVIDTDMPMGRHYNGQGVHVAMGDDGSVGPHIDYQGRLNNAPAAANNAGDHGDHCGGIIMGAGNLDPKAKGMAAGATLHVFNVYDAINRLNQTYAADSVRITSISYSQVCNGGYTSDSRSLDLKTRQYPSLIPVFSAGNAGQQSCSPVGSGWYNITGGYKSAKNVITVANLDYLDQLNTSSSRGPAADGRIKPDIAAVGTNVWSTISTNTAGNMYGFKTGTSMSCPAVSGTCAQLFHAYRSLHSGQDPANGLIKALLLNTAEDLGNPGPDFRFGYGRINAARAVRVLETNRWFEDSLDQGQTRTHTIAVPPGTQHLRVMVYWTDVEGSSSTTRPLVNNLDAVLTGSGGTAWHPWVLDPTPDPARLDAPAVRAVDSLNNMEQITLDNPASGSYTLTVEGTSVPFGMQRYFVVVELQDTDVTLTYPIGGEGFAPADRETIRWDAYGSLAPFDISYSIDNGTTWQPIITGLSPELRAHNWLPPLALAGKKVLMRVQRGPSISQSASPFSIVNVPGNVRIVSICPDTVEVTWNPTLHAARYVIYRLGERYMDSIATTNTNRISLAGLSPLEEDWLSVQAISATGARSRRALAIRKPTGTLNCTLTTDMALVEILNPLRGELPTCTGQQIPVVVSVRNEGVVPLTNLLLNYRLNSGLVTTDTLAGPLLAGSATTFTFTHPLTFVGPSSHVLRVWLRAPGDRNAFNDTLTIALRVVAGQPMALPSVESFTGQAVCPVASTLASCPSNCNLTGSAGWRNAANGLTDDIDWQAFTAATPSSGTGPDRDHTSGTGPYLYLEATQCLSKTGVLVSPCYDLTGLTQPEFSFWYHMSGGQMGRLHLDVLADGRWQLDVMPVLQGHQGTGWLPRTVSLAAYSGRTVVLRLRGTTGTGVTSDIGLDDLSVHPNPPTGIAAALTGGQVSLYPNPTAGAVRLTRPEEAKEKLTVRVLDALGRQVLTSEMTGSELSLPLDRLPEGPYFIRLTGEATSTVKAVLRVRE